MIAHALERLSAHPVEHAVHIPRAHRPVRNRNIPVRHDQLGIDLHRGAQPCAFRARAMGTVKRKHPWREFLETDPAIHARVMLALQGLTNFPIRSFAPDSNDAVAML